MARVTGKSETGTTFAAISALIFAENAEKAGGPIAVFHGCTLGPKLAPDIQSRLHPM